MKETTGMILIIISVLFIWLFFGWQLSLAIFVAIVGNNLIERK